MLLFEGKRACFLAPSDLGMQRRWKGNGGVILERPGISADFFFSSSASGGGVDHAEGEELQGFRTKYPLAFVVDEEWIVQSLQENQLLSIQRFLLPPDRWTSTSNLRVDQFLSL